MFEGQEYDQEEWFFVVRTPTFEPTSSEWTDVEAATIRGWQWWSIEGLRSTQDLSPIADYARSSRRLATTLSRCGTHRPTLRR